VKNSRVIELHNTCHYVFIVDEALVVRETRKFLIDECVVHADEEMTAFLELESAICACGELSRQAREISP